MAGHSKWAQIKRKKAVTDAKRGQLFTKLIREITVAARLGPADPDFNPRLRMAVEAAKAANMPADNIERAIKKGTGELEGVQYDEVVYEGYGPGGVALLIETTTDNQKRTVAEIRHLLDRAGGNLGTSGSVAWQFDRKGRIYVDASRYHEEAVFEAAIEAGAEDVQREGDEYIVTTEVAAFHGVQAKLRAVGVEFSSAELTYLPRTEVPVLGKDAERLLKLLEALEENDDVQKVHSNADIDDAVLAVAG